MQKLTSENVFSIITRAIRKYLAGSPHILYPKLHLVKQLRKYLSHCRFDPFHGTVLFLYPLKTRKNLWFSHIFRGYWKISTAWNGLIRLRGIRLLVAKSLIPKLRIFIQEKKYIQLWRSISNIFFQQKSSKIYKYNILLKCNFDNYQFFPLTTFLGEVIELYL